MNFLPVIRCIDVYDKKLLLNVCECNPVFISVYVVCNLEVPFPH